MKHSKEQSVVFCKDINAAKTVAVELGTKFYTSDLSMILDNSDKLGEYNLFVGSMDPEVYAELGGVEAEYYTFLVGQNGIKDVKRVIKSAISSGLYSSKWEEIDPLDLPENLEKITSMRNKFGRNDSVEQVRKIQSSGKTPCIAANTFIKPWATHGDLVLEVSVGKDQKSYWLVKPDNIVQEANASSSSWEL